MAGRDLAEAARAALAPHVASGYVAGAAALVGRGEGAGGVPRGPGAIGGAPVTRDSLFRIASMTKPVTAVAALMLIEEGRLALDEPVDRLMPELADRRVLTRIDAELDDTVPAERPITVEDVLSFRLGLGIVMAPPDSYPIQRQIAALGLMGFGMPDPSSPHDPDEWARRLGRLPLMAQPGAQWLYTAGSNVLGVLVARASGQSLPDFFEQRIFRPLGMADTGFVAPPGKVGRLVSGYRRVDGRLELWDPAEGGAWTRPPAFPAGDSGLVSTLDDVFAFSGMLAHGGEAGGRRLLSPASIAAMTTNHLTPAQRAGGAMILGPGRGWGHGVSVALEDTADGVPAGTYGWNGGFGTSWAVDPRTDTTAILLTQTLFDTPEAPAIHQAFWRAAFGG
jgi:CubicO group peptidase (beta-lactamase class C family)